MSKRLTLAGLATAFVIGGGTLIGGSIAGSTSAAAFTLLPGHGPYPIVDPGFIRRGHGGWGHHRRHWGHGYWGYGPRHIGFHGGCYTVIKTRFVPGLGLVERQVRRCY
jgi:hypothetical protein